MKESSNRLFFKRLHKMISRDSILEPSSIFKLYTSLLHFFCCSVAIAMEADYIYGRIRNLV